MSLDEKVFGYFNKLIRSKIVSRDKKYFFKLESCKSRLEILASMLNQKKIHIYQTDLETISTTNTIFLPREILSRGSDVINYNYYLYLVLSHYESIKLSKFYHQDLGSYEKNQINNSLLINTEIKNEFPQFFSELVIFDDVLFPIVPENKIIFFENVKSSQLQKENLKNVSNIKSKVKTAGRPDLIDLEKKEENPIVHNFEKIKTLDDFSGGTRSLDGSDDLDEESDALEELSLSSIIRSDVQTETMLKSDAVIENGTLVVREENKALICKEYPEWFYKEGRYRERWCQVVEHDIEESVTFELPHYDKSLAKRFKDDLSFLYNASREKRKQVEGQEIGLDELIRYQIEKKIYKKDTPEIFIKKTKQEKDFSILFLIDSSLSTDSYVQDRRILDLFKNISYMLSDSFLEIENQIAFYSFYSNTRNNCVVEKIKSFPEDMNQLKKNIYQLRPKGYTRIGAAIRHSISLLKSEKSKKNFLFILSDGKPTDFDRYEGEHGQQDTKKALSELESLHGMSHLFTFASKRRKDNSKIFSRHNVSIISDEKQFITCLSTFLHCYL